MIHVLRDEGRRSSDTRVARDAARCDAEQEGGYWKVYAPLSNESTHCIDQPLRENASMKPGTRIRMEARANARIKNARI